MKETDLSDTDLRLLVEKTFQKVEDTEKYNSKISAEMSNTLNWILTLTTLFIGISIQNYKNVLHPYLKDLFVAEKIIFAFSLIMLIAYKIINLKYEKQKKNYLANLNTHKLELFFDISHKLKPKLSSDIFFVPSFINRFRKGELIPNYDIKRKEAFLSIEKKIHVYEKLLKLIYTLTMIAFLINLIITIILLMNISGD